MNLEKMKKIADMRTPGFWTVQVMKDILCMAADASQYTHNIEADAEFISMTSNHWDKLMAIVEAAKNLMEIQDHYRGVTTNASIRLSHLEKALKEIE